MNSPERAPSPSGTQPAPLVVGAMCVDLKGWSRHSLVPRTSNTETLGRRPGGVGFNLAANLARLGCRPTFLSALGDDVDGDYLLAQCASPGIDTRHVQRVRGASTPVYLADGRLGGGGGRRDGCG